MNVDRLGVRRLRSFYLRFKIVLKISKLCIFSQSEMYDGILLLGPKEFIKKLSATLDILKAKSATGYDLVKRHIQIIAHSRRSGVFAWLNPTMCEISDAVLVDYIDGAGILAHQAYEVKGYHAWKQHRINKREKLADTLDEEQLERKCLAFQVEVLQDLCADQALIDYYKNDAFSTRYWEIPEREQDW